ncbi:MAG: hypothetical protein AB8H86_18240 [Polyangiales bacterium]
MEKPDPGKVIELDGDAVSFDAIGALIGLDFEEELTTPDALIGTLWPAVIIGGDLLIEGDVSSKALPAGLEGYTRKDSAGHFIIVLGNLVVRGNLEVEQYFDLIVAGDVDAYSYRSHSANFVATGELRARDIICTEANEEGGIFQPRKARAPAWVRVGYYYDDRVDFEGLEIHGEEFDGPHRERAQHAAFAALGKPRAEDDDLWQPLESCIVDGKVPRFLEAYEKKEKSRSALETDEDPLRRVHIPKSKSPYHQLTGLWTSEEEVVAVGGYHSNCAYQSLDGGRSFDRFAPKLQNKGLRSIQRIGKEWWVCGANGLLAHSTNLRKKYKVIKLGTRACLQTVLAADDALWVTGDSGAYRSSDGGETWARLEEVEGEITRPQDSIHGVLLPSHKGHLYLCKKGAITKTALETESSPWAATCTKKGTILVVCSKGKVHRSTDAGASFTFVQTDAPGSLENIVALDDGWIVAVGEHGAILESSDDGVSFAPLEHPFTKKWIFALHKWRGNSAMIGCEHGMIFKYERSKGG